MLGTDSRDLLDKVDPNTPAVKQLFWDARSLIGFAIAVSIGGCAFVFYVLTRLRQRNQMAGLHRSIRLVDSAFDEAPGSDVSLDLMDSPRA